MQKFRRDLRNILKRCTKEPTIITLTTPENSISYNFKPDNLTMLRHFGESYENLRRYSRKLHKKELPHFKTLLEFIGFKRKELEEIERQKLSYIG